MISECLNFCKIRDVKSPHKGTSDSAGVDVFVPNDFQSIILFPGENVLIPLGIKVKIPSGYAIFVCNKGGVATKRSLVYGSHIIDSDYQGEVLFDCHNIGIEPQIIKPGEKITQLVMLPVVNIFKIHEYNNDEELYWDKVSERGEGGFGSTGVN